MFIDVFMPPNAVFHVTVNVLEITYILHIHAHMHKYEIVWYYLIITRYNYKRMV